MSSAIKFIEKPEAGIVVATVSGLKDNIDNVISNISGLYVYSERMSKIIDRMPDRLSAVARCAPQDEFDSKVGKDYAKARLIIKIERAKRRAFEEIIDIFFDNISYLNNKAAKCRINELVNIAKLVHLDENYSEDNEEQRNLIYFSISTE